jgi:hypothetical protein
MVKTISLSAQVSPKHQILFTLPEDVPQGLADIVVVVIPREPAQTQNDITARLNQIYATESSTLDPVLAKMQFASLGVEQW